MFKRQLGNHRGVSIVEFALVLPLLLAFLGFTVDFGLAFFVSHMAQNAAREGARLAVTIRGANAGPLCRSERGSSGRQSSARDQSLSRFYAYQDVLPRACQVTVTVNGQSPYFFLPAFLVSMPNPQGSPREHRDQAFGRDAL